MSEKREKKEIEKAKMKRKKISLSYVADAYKKGRLRLFLYACGVDDIHIRLIEKCLYEHEHNNEPDKRYIYYAAVQGVVTWHNILTCD